MKKQITLLLLAILVLASTSCGPTSEDAIKYNDKIINEQVLIINKMNTLYKSLDDYKNHEQMDRCYSETMKQIETGTDVVSKLDKFGGNSDFKDAALKLFGVYKMLMQNEFKQMIAINKLPDEQYTTEVKEKMTQLNDMSIKKLDDGLAELQAVQSAFAKKYKFEIKKT